MIPNNNHIYRIHWAVAFGLPFAVLVLACLLLSGCASRRYVREQVAIAKCDIVLRQIDRENNRRGNRIDPKMPVSDVGLKARERTRKEFE